MKNLHVSLYVLLCIFSFSYSRLTKIQADCELEALNIGTRLADRFNSFDEKTEQDVRLHHDYLVKNMGFAGWIQSGLWKNTKLTALKNNAPELYRVPTHLPTISFSCLKIILISSFSSVFVICHFRREVGQVNRVEVLQNLRIGH